MLTDTTEESRPAETRKATTNERRDARRQELVKELAEIRRERAERRERRRLRRLIRKGLLPIEVATKPGRDKPDESEAPLAAAPQPTPTQQEEALAALLETEGESESTEETPPAVGEPSDAALEEAPTLPETPAVDPRITKKLEQEEAKAARRRAKEEERQTRQRVAAEARRAKQVAKEEKARAKPKEALAATLSEAEPEPLAQESTAPATPGEQEELLTLPEETPEDVAPPIDRDADRPVTDIEGIGPEYAKRLRKLRIETLSELAEANATQVAKKLKAAETTVRQWQSMAQLIRLNGVGPQYAEVLVRAGIVSIPSLAQAEPKELWKAVEKATADRQIPLQGAPLSQKVIKSWIENAKEHPSANAPVRTETSVAEPETAADTGTEPAVESARPPASRRWFGAKKEEAIPSTPGEPEPAAPGDERIVPAQGPGTRPRFFRFGSKGEAPAAEAEAASAKRTKWRLFKRKTIAAGNAEEEAPAPPSSEAAPHLEPTTPAPNQKKAAARKRPPTKSKRKR